MKIVIDIPEEIRKAIINNIQHELNSDQRQLMISCMESAIANGTPLPKGHGRLIDADALPLDKIDDANYGSNYIHIAPTIIEADTERSE